MGALVEKWRSNPDVVTGSLSRSHVSLLRVDHDKSDS